MRFFNLMTPVISLSLLVPLGAPAKADPLMSAAKFEFITLQPFYAGVERRYERSGNSFSTTSTNEQGTFTQRVTLVDRCTFQFDFERPPTIATKSTSMQINLSGFKRSNMSQAKAGNNGDIAVKISGIQACNVGQHPEYWNGHIPPGSCATTFFKRIGDDGARQRAGLNEMVQYCKSGA